MSNIAKVLKWIREVDVKSLPYGVSSIGWGPKISNGKETGEYSLIFVVAKKQNLEDLKIENIIPSTFEVEGVSVATDVQEPVLQNILYTDCHPGATEYNPSQPIASHRQKHRPLQGGISSIFLAGSDATLGLLVRDKTDGSVVGLSNNHVYAASKVIASTARWHNGFTSFDSEVNTMSRTTLLSITAIQPALSSQNPYGANTVSEPMVKDSIGFAKRDVPIGNISNDESFYGVVSGPGMALVLQESSCDAAILQLSSYDLLNSQSVNVLNFSQPGPYRFATDEEIDSLLDPGSINFGSPIFRAGRTIGPVGFPGYTNSCNLSVSQFGTEMVAFYSNHYLSNFSNSFRVRGNVVPGRGGDSGSAMFALLSSTVPSASAWKCIGLLFAGPNEAFPSYTIGCRITSIVRDLAIAPWDGTIPTLSSTRTVVERINTYSPTIELSGRKYYQIGFRGD